jgi:uncharacterized membrane protein YqjE
VSDDVRGQPWVQSLQELVAALPGLLTDRFELLALELGRAGRAVVRIAMLVLLAALLSVTAWLALCGGIALALGALGLSWPLAMLTVLLLNLILAWAAVARIGHLTTNLGLPATRRHLVFGADAESATGGRGPIQPTASPPGYRP